MTDWMRQGCAECRQGILTGRRDVLVCVATSREAHAYLRRCSACGAWWEEGEREAHVIGQAEARTTFAGYFIDLAEDGPT